MFASSLRRLPPSLLTFPSNNSNPSSSLSSSRVLLPSSSSTLNQEIHSATLSTSSSSSSSLVKQLSHKLHHSIDSNDVCRLMNKAIIQLLPAPVYASDIFRYLLSYYYPFSSFPPQPLTSVETTNNPTAVDYVPIDNFIRITNNEVFYDLSSNLLTDDDIDTLVYAYNVKYSTPSCIDTAHYVSTVAFFDPDVQSQVRTLRQIITKNIIHEINDKDNGRNSPTTAVNHTVSFTQHFLLTLKDLLKKDTLSTSASSSSSSSVGMATSRSFRRTSSNNNNNNNTSNDSFLMNVSSSASMVTVTDLRAAFLELQIPTGILEDSSSSSSSVSSIVDFIDVRIIHRYLRNTIYKHYAITWYDFVKFVIDITEDLFIRLIPSLYASFVVLPSASNPSPTQSTRFMVMVQNTLSTSSSTTTPLPKGASNYLSPHHHYPPFASPSTGSLSATKPPRIPSSSATVTAYTSPGNENSMLTNTVSARSRPVSKYTPPKDTENNENTVAPLTSPVNTFTIPSTPIPNTATTNTTKNVNSSLSSTDPSTMTTNGSKLPVVSPITGTASSLSSSSSSSPSESSSLSSVLTYPIHPLSYIMDVAISRRSSQEASNFETGYEEGLYKFPSFSSSGTTEYRLLPDLSAGSAVYPVRLWVHRAEQANLSVSHTNDVYRWTKAYESFAILPPGSDKQDKLTYTNDGYIEIEPLAGGATLYGRKFRIKDIDNALDNDDKLPIVITFALTMTTVPMDEDECLPNKTNMKNLLAPVPLLDCFPIQRTLISLHTPPPIINAVAKEENYSSDIGKSTWIAAGTWTLRTTPHNGANTTNTPATTNGNRNERTNLCLWYLETEIHPDVRSPTKTLTTASTKHETIVSPPKQDKLKSPVPVPPSTVSATKNEPKQMDEPERSRRHHHRRRIHYRHHHRRPSYDSIISEITDDDSVASASSFTTSSSSSTGSSSGDSDDSYSRRYHGRHRHRHHRSSSRHRSRSSKHHRHHRSSSASNRPKDEETKTVTTMVPVIPTKVTDETIKSTEPKPEIVIPPNDTKEITTSTTSATTTTVMNPPPVTETKPKDTFVDDSATKFRGVLAVDVLRLREMLIPSGSSLPKVRVWFTNESDPPITTLSTVPDACTDYAEATDRDDEFVFSLPKNSTTVTKANTSVTPSTTSLPTVYRGTNIRLRGNYAELKFRIPSQSSANNTIGTPNPRSNNVPLPNSIPSQFREGILKTKVHIAVVTEKKDTNASSASSSSSSTEMGRITVPLLDILDNKYCIDSYHDIYTNDSMHRFAGTVRLAIVWSSLTKDEITEEQKKETEIERKRLEEKLRAEEASKSARKTLNSQRFRDVINQAMSASKTSKSVTKSTKKDTTTNLNTSSASLDDSSMDINQTMIQQNDNGDSQSIYIHQIDHNGSRNGSKEELLPLLLPPVFSSRQIALFDRIRNEYTAAQTKHKANTGSNSPVSSPLGIIGACADIDILCTGLIPGKALLRILPRIGLRMDTSSVDRLVRFLFEIMNIQLVLYTPNQNNNSSSSSNGTANKTKSLLSSPLKSPATGGTKSTSFSNPLVTPGKSNVTVGNSSNEDAGTGNNGSASSGWSMITPNLTDYGEGIYIDYILLSDLLSLPTFMIDSSHNNHNNGKTLTSPGKSSSSSTAGTNTSPTLSTDITMAIFRSMIRHRLRLNLAANRSKHRSTFTTATLPNASTKYPPIPFSIAATITLPELREEFFRMSRPFLDASNNQRAMNDPVWLMNTYNNSFTLPLVVMGDALEDNGCILRTNDLGSIIAYHNAYVPGADETLSNHTTTNDTATTDRGRLVDISLFANAVIGNHTLALSSIPGASTMVTHIDAVSSEHHAPLSMYEQIFRTSLRECTWCTSHLDFETLFIQTMETYFSTTEKGTGTNNGLLLSKLKELSATLNDTVIPVHILRKVCDERLIITLNETVLQDILRRCKVTADPSSGKPLLPSSLSTLIGDKPGILLPSSANAIEQSIDETLLSLRKFFTAYLDLEDTEYAHILGKIRSFAITEKEVEGAMRSLHGNTPHNNPSYDQRISYIFQTYAGLSTDYTSVYGPCMPSRLFLRAIRDAQLPIHTPEDILLARKFRIRSNDSSFQSSFIPTPQGFLVRYEPCLRLFLGYNEVVSPLTTTMNNEARMPTHHKSLPPRPPTTGNGTVTTGPIPSSLDSQTVAFLMSMADPNQQLVIQDVVRRSSIVAATDGGNNPLMTNMTNEPLSRVRRYRNSNVSISSNGSKNEGPIVPSSTITFNDTEQVMNNVHVRHGTEKDALTFPFNTVGRSSLHLSSITDQPNDTITSNVPTVQAISVEQSVESVSQGSSSSRNNLIVSPTVPSGATSQDFHERVLTYKTTGRYVCAVCLYTGNRPYSRQCSMCDADNPYSTALTVSRPSSSPPSSSSSSASSSNEVHGTVARSSDESTTANPIAWLCPACTFTCPPNTKECLMCGSRLVSPFSSPDELVRVSSTASMLPPPSTITPAVAPSSSSASGLTSPSGSMVPSSSIPGSGLPVSPIALPVNLASPVPSSTATTVSATPNPGSTATIVPLVHVNNPPVSSGITYINDPWTSRRQRPVAARNSGMDSHLLPPAPSSLTASQATNSPSNTYTPFFPSYHHGVPTPVGSVAYANSNIQTTPNNYGYPNPSSTSMVPPSATHSQALLHVLRNGGSLPPSGSNTPLHPSMLQTTIPATSPTVPTGITTTTKGLPSATVKKASVLPSPSGFSNENQPPLSLSSITGVNQTLTGPFSGGTTTSTRPSTTERLMDAQTSLVRSRVR